MPIEYRVDGDELVIDTTDPTTDRKALWKRLKRFGVPLEIERTVAVTQARLPREGVAKLTSTLKMLGTELVPAAGEASLEDLGKEEVRYEDVRPVDPEEAVELARVDEHPRRILERAIADLGTFAMENLGFEHRVEGDKRFLRRALERWAPKPGPAAETHDPVNQRVSQAIARVPDEDKWRARELLLDLHEVASQAQGEIPTAPVPDPIPGFHGKLRGYQETGVGFLLGAKLNAILADQMGLGKTVQTIAAILSADTRALVVCPANVLHNWAAEVARFTGEPVAFWHGRELSGPPEARFRITTYNSLRFRDWRDTDADQRPVLVLDEAHEVRNPETQRARLVEDLPQQHRILLTGTPIVNGLEDYNELLGHIGEGRWAEGNRFKQTWMADPGVLARNPRVRTHVADLLQQATRHVVLRRRKDEVLDDLPPRTVTLLAHVLSQQERAAYEGLEARAREVMAAAKSEVQVFAQLHKLRQFLLDKRAPLLKDRVDALVAEDEACVVYSHYLEPLKRLHAHLGEEVSARLDGSTPPERREKLSRALGADDGPRVLLAQIEAGGIGLNLTGARHVLFAHLGWTAAIHRQAIDRVHRIGQDRPVQVEFLITPDTIDERLADIILRKEADANLALADEGDVLNRSQLAKIVLEEPGTGQDG